MGFNKYDSLDNLNDSKDEWIIRVRAQSIWKGINRESGEFRGYNIIFFDDSSARIHAFIAAQIATKFETDLKEGDIYIVEKFTVTKYNGDETSRAVRNERHIYFTSQTKLEKDGNHGLTIPSHSFDFFNLDDVQTMKTDNRFLTDVVAIIENVPAKSVNTNDTAGKSHVGFKISDGRTTINVTFFNEFGESFLKANEHIQEQPVIIIIASVKVSVWKEVVYLTNFPATRFYLNLNHSAVNLLRKRLGNPNFYVVDIDDDDDEEDCNVPIMTVAEIRNLNEASVQRKVVCQITVKKFDEKMSWYSPFCIKCDKDVSLIDKSFTCSECHRSYPYPDKRFRLYSLCSDKTGAIPIVWPDDEICRLTGKTVYDVEAEETEVEGSNKIPDLLKSFEKKTYKITILLTEENLKQGSQVYTACTISKPLEMSDDHSPNANQTTGVEQTEISIQSAQKDIISRESSPPTEKSSNRTRPRNVVEPVEYHAEPSPKLPKLRNIKIEKI